MHQTFLPRKPLNLISIKEFLQERERERERDLFVQFLMFRMVNMDESLILS